MYKKGGADLKKLKRMGPVPIQLCSDDYKMMHTKFSLQFLLFAILRNYILSHHHTILTHSHTAPVILLLSKNSIFNGICLVNLFSLGLDLWRCRFGSFFYLARFGHIMMVCLICSWRVHRKHYIEDMVEAEYLQRYVEEDTNISEIFCANTFLPTLAYHFVTIFLEPLHAECPYCSRKSKHLWIDPGRSDSYRFAGMFVRHFVNHFFHHTL